MPCGVLFGWLEQSRPAVQFPVRRSIIHGLFASWSVIDEPSTQFSEIVMASNRHVFVDTFWGCHHSCGDVWHGALSERSVTVFSQVAMLLSIHLQLVMETVSLVVISSGDAVSTLHIDVVFWLCLIKDPVLSKRFGLCRYRKVLFTLSIWVECGSLLDCQSVLGFELLLVDQALATWLFSPRV